MFILRRSCSKLLTKNNNKTRPRFSIKTPMRLMNNGVANTEKIRTADTRLCFHCSSHRNWIDLNNNNSIRRLSLSTQRDNVNRQLSLKDAKVQHYIEKLALNSDESQRHDPNLQKVVREINQRLKDLKELRLLAADNEELKEIARKDEIQITQELLNLESEFFETVLEPEPLDENDAILEISAGVGGQEAMLFAHELFRMYQNFALYHGLEFAVTECNIVDGGGMRSGSAAVSGRGVYQKLKFEGGVHRVQRIPKTEKAGRVHTSTARVAILPLPTEIQVVINPSDLKYEAKKATGAGGQHVNTTESAIRLTHAPTGIVVECQMERSQIRNKEVALRMLRAKIYERRLEAQTKSIQSKRKLQMGMGTRSEKIRTYNFAQDRVTDHRVGLAVYNLKGVIDGKEALDELVNKLLEYDHNERIAQLFS